MEYAYYLISQYLTGARFHQNLYLDAQKMKEICAS